MRRSAKSLSLPAAILVAILVAAGLAVGAAGCAGAGSTVKGAISSVASNLPSRSATAGSATTAGSGTSLIWLWILLGAVLAAVLIAWITRVARRGSSTAAADWRSRLVGAYAQGSALHDAMSVAETSVPDPADQMRIADTLASLQAETVRGRLDVFESSLQALRTDDQRYP
jgi:hypothetical protein